jgi:hypothetical protein
VSAPSRLTSVSALESAVALLTAFLAQATYLAARNTLLSTLAALLILSAAGFLPAILTTRSLLTSPLLTATRIFFTIVCHVFLPCLKSLNANVVFEFEYLHPFELCCIHSKQIAAIALRIKQLEQEECHRTSLWTGLVQLREAWLNASISAMSTVLSNANDSARTLNQELQEPMSQGNLLPMALSAGKTDRAVVV